MSEITKPRVAIQIVTYKAVEAFQECLESLSWFLADRQSDLYVIDNSELEEISEILSSYPDVNIEPSRGNIGFGKGHNTLYEKTNGSYDFVLLLNPDLLLTQEAFDQLVDRMAKKASSLGLLAPQLYGYDGELEYHEIGDLNPYIYPVQRVSERVFRSRNSIHSHTATTLSGACLLINTAVTDDQIFDPNFFMYLEDVDLCRRVKANGYDIEVLPEAQVKHRRGESSREHEREGMNYFLYTEWGKSSLYFSQKHYSRGAAHFFKIYLTAVSLFRVVSLKGGVRDEAAYLSQILRF